MSFWDKLFFWRRIEPKVKEELEFFHFDEWIVEYKGVDIGELKRPAYEDMFWTSYAIIPKKGMEFFFRDIKNWQEEAFKYKSKKTGEYAEGAFSNKGYKEKYIENENRNMRVTMRRLYIVRKKSIFK